MRERKLPTGEFEREAIETLSRFVPPPSETAVEWTGYLEGAIESGERAAIEVLQRL